MSGDHESGQMRKCSSEKKLKEVSGELRYESKLEISQTALPVVKSNTECTYSISV